MKSFLKILSWVSLLMAVVLMGAGAFPAEAQHLASAVPHGPQVLAALVNTHGLALACVPVPIASIVADEFCPNPGGLTDLWVIGLNDIETFPAPDADGVTLSTAIVPKTGKGFAKWDFVQDTGEVTHKGSGELGSQSIAHGMDVTVARGSAATDAVIQTALNRKLIAIGRDSNGNLRVLGDKNRGVKFEYDYKSGKKGTDKNAAEFKFAGEGFTHVPYYYTAAIPLKA